MLEQSNTSEPVNSDNKVEKNVGINKSVSEKNISNVKSTITTCTRTSNSTRPRSSAYDYKPPTGKVFSLKKKSNTNTALNVSSIHSSCHTMRKETKPKTATTKTATSKIGATKTGVTKAAATKTALTKSVVTILPPKHRSVDPPSNIKKDEKKNFLPQNYALNGAKKTFDSLKKKVELAQTDLLNSYNSLQQIRNKHALEGKQSPKEEIKLMSVVIDDVEDFLLKINGKTVKPNKNAATANKRTVTDILKLDDFKSTYNTIDETCTKICQAMLEQFTNLSPESGDPSASGKDVSQIAKLIETNVTAIKDQMNILNKTVNELDTIPVKPVPPKAEIIKPYEKEISRLNEELTKMASGLTTKTAALKQVEDVVKKLRSQVANKDSVIVDKKQEIEKVNKIKKSVEEEKKDLEKKLVTLNEAITAKNVSIKKLSNELDSLKARFKKTDGVINDFKKQEDEISRLKEKEEDARKKYQNEHKKCLELKDELEERDCLISKLNKDIAKERSCNATVGDDLQDLKAKLEKALNDKNSAIKEKNNLQKQFDELNADELKSDLVETRKENNNLTKANESLRTHICSMEKTLQKKQKLIIELEKYKEQWTDVESTVHKLKSEINRIQQSEREKNIELDKLRHDLSKALLEIKQHEETIVANQRLLRIRNELIITLQEKDAKFKSQLEDLHEEISKKTALINQMNYDMASKAEDFHNLFSTFGSQQTEVSRQEYIIKHLQETNEKHQRYQEKQKERMLSIERENADLKRLIDRYNQKRNK